MAITRFNAKNGLSVGTGSIGVIDSVGNAEFQALGVTGSITPAASGLYDIGSSTRQWRNMFVTNISGSFTGSNVTAGQVVVAGTGGVLSGSNNLFWLNSNNRLGIGTSSPTYPLEVNNSGGTDLIKATNSVGSYLLTNYDFYAPSSFRISAGGTGYLNLAAGAGSTNCTVTLTTNNVLRLLADSTGNIGIGTGQNITSRFLVSGSGATSSTSALHAVNSSGRSLFFVRDDGNVGVGTANPAYDLHVSGSTIGFINANTPPDFSPSVQLTIGGSVKPAYIRAAPRDWYGNNYYLDIATQASTTSLKTFVRILTEDVERMRVDGSGNVGIGTTNPSARFHVTGGRTILASSDGYELAFGRTASYFYFHNDGGGATGKLTLTATAGITAPIATFFQQTQDVGIGTTSFTARLFVSGSSTASTPTMIVREGVVSPTGGVGVLDVQNSAGSSLLFVSSSTYVGIGTNAPIVALDILSAGGQQIRLRGTGTSTETRIIANYGGNALAAMGTVDSFPLMFMTSNTERVRIDTSGNVGIGTSALAGLVNANSTRVTIGGSNAAANAAEFIAGGAAASISMASGASVAYLFMPGAYPMTFWTSGLERMRIDASGNVGIGTNNPARPLHVNGSLRLANASVVEYGGTSASIAGESSTNTLFFNTNSTERVRIDTSGNVGIGTVSPNARLDVSGSSTASTPTMVVREGVASPTGGVGVFNVQNSAGTSLFFVSGSGNVGVGTNNPTARFHVSDNQSNSTVRFHLANINGSGGPLRIGYFSDSSGFHITANGNPAHTNIISNTVTRDYTARFAFEMLNILTTTSDNSYVDFRFAGGSTFSSAMRVRADGNVGIGITNPSVRLDIASGSMRGYYYLSTYDGELLAGADAGGYYFATGFGKNTAIPILIGSNATNIIMSAGGSERLRIAGSSGNVGIGTATPSTVFTRMLTLHNAGSAGISFSSTNHYAIGANGNLLQFYDVTNGVTRAIIDVTGNFGIGNSTTASARFQVSGSSTASTPTAVIREGVASPTGGVGVLDVQNSSGTSLMFLSGSGWFGLGTNSPSQKMHISNNGSVYTQWQDTSGGGLIGYVGANAGGGVFEISSPSSIRFWVNNAERARIDTSGNVGIGTPTYTARLFVSGSSTASIPTTVLRAGTSSPTGPVLDVQDYLGNTLVVISGSGNVGLGTTSPAQTLDIRNTAPYQLRVGSSPGFSYDIGRNTTDGLLYFYGNQTGANGFVFSGFNGERARIDASGNVGIGTSAMDARLVVNGNTVLSGTLNPDLDNSRDFGSSTKRWRTIFAANISGSLTGSNVTAGQVVVAGTGGVLSGSNNLFWNNSSGSLGIGTSSSTAKFEVVGVSGSLFSVTDQLSGSLFSVNTISGLPILEVFSDNTVVAGAYGSNALVVTGSNVGIGISLPQAKLDIRGAASTYTLLVSGSTTFGSSFGQIINAGSNSGDVSLRVRNYNGTSDYFMVRGDGNVGIATASPLTSAGNGLTIYGSTNGSLYLQNSSNHARIFAQGNELYIDNGTGGSAGSIIFRRSSSTTESARIDSSGNVGIGTNNPGTRLDVAGAARSSYGVFSGSLTAYASSTGALYAYYVSSTSILLSAADNSATAAPLDIFTGATRAMRVDTSQNVGIGTATYTARLFVSGTSTASTPTMVVREGVASPTGGALAFDVKNSAGTSVLLVSGSGNVGINMSPTSFPLGVFRGATTTPQISAVGTSGVSGVAGYNLRIDSTDLWQLITDNNASNGFYVQYNTGVAARYLAITTGGSVGIGVTNPSASYKLQVNGSLAAWDGTNGRVVAVPSNSANTGYIEWRNGSATRLGYMGGGSSTNMNITMENSANLLIDGGRVGIGVTAAGISGGGGNTWVEGRLIITETTNSASLSIPYGTGTPYAGFKVVHVGANVGGAADFTDFRMRPAYASGVGSAGDVNVIRFNNTYARNFPDVLLVPSGGFAAVGAVPTPAAQFTVSGSSTSSTPTMLVREGVANPTGGALVFEVENSAGGTILAVTGSGLVGINTASPNAHLAVYNASLPTFTLHNSSNYTRLASSGNDFYIDTGLGGTGGATIFRRGSGTTENARIDASGNVGIGTNNPGQKLHIANAGATYLRLHNTSAGYAYDLGPDASGNFIFSLSGVAQRLSIDTSGNLLPGANNSYDLGSSGTRWRDIYVRSGSYTGDVTISGNLTVAGTQTIVNSETVNIKDNIILLNSTASPQQYGGIYVADTTANTTGSLRWNSSTDRWEAGLAGSEATLPTGSGTTNTIPLWSNSSTLGNSIITQSSTLITVGGSQRVNTILSIGGATTGYGILQVVSDDALTAPRALSIRGSTDGNKNLWLGYNTTGNYGSVQAFFDGTSASPLALNPSGGNVGVGITNPGAILHTLTSGNTTGIFASTASRGWVELRRSTSTTLGYIGTGGGLITGAADADLAFRCESGGILFSSVAAERMRIDSSGNVGINTTTMTLRLEVSGSDARIHDVRIGRGAGSVVTNTAVGNGALTQNTTGPANTAFGNGALGQVTTGGENTAVGELAGSSISTEYRNSYVGRYSGLFMRGAENTAIGARSLYGVLTVSNANSNTAVGAFSGFAITTASFNTLIGAGSGGSLTTGGNNFMGGYQAGTNQSTATNNVMVGYQSGYNVTSGSNNAFVGYLAGGSGPVTAAYLSYFGSLAGTYQSGGNNTGIGHASLYGVQNVSNATNNTAIGFYSGFAVTTGGNNFFGGYQAGTANTTGISNVMIGYQSGYSNSTGNYNTYVGNTVSYASTSGSFNVVMGHQAAAAAVNAWYLTYLGVNSGFWQTGGNNTAIGHNALVGSSGASATNNTAIGKESGYSVTTGGSNFFGGYQAGYSQSTATNNTLVGNQAGVVVTSGSNNTFIGSIAGQSTTTGANNTFLGYGAGNTTTTGNNNIYLGVNTTGSANNNTNETVIGFTATGRGSNTTTIGNGSITLTLIPSGSLALAGTATGTNAVSLGLGNVASGDYSTATGRNNVASTLSTVALGEGNTSNSSYSVTIGRSNTSSGAYNVAIGQGNASSGTNNATAIGYSNTASGASSVAMGQFSLASGAQAIAIGSYVTGSNTSAVAMGANSTASSPYAFAMGYNNAVGGQSSAAIGQAINITREYSAGFGANQTISGPQSITAGFNNLVSGGNSAAFGTFNTASGASSFVAGQYSLASGAQSIAIGQYVTGSANNAIAIGSGSLASGVASIAFGELNTSSTTNSIAIGKSNTSGGSSSTAIGRSNSSSGTDSIAIGAANISNNTSAAAIGTSNTSSGNTSFAAGFSNSASNFFSVALGAYNASSGFYSFAAGGTNTASGTSSVAMGQFSLASGAQAIAMGNASTGSFPGSVAIGSGSLASNTEAVAFGARNTASGLNSVAIGTSNTANAQLSTALGGIFNVASGVYSVAVGAYNAASGASSFVSGLQATAYLNGQRSHSAGGFSTGGDAQISTLVARNSTTDATTTELFLNGGATLRAVLPASTTWDAEVTIVARSSGGTSNASFRRRCLIKRDASNNTELVGPVQVVGSDIGSNFGSPPTGWAVTLSADNTNESLKIEVTGAAATNIRWVAKIELTEVGFA